MKAVTPRAGAEERLDQSFKAAEITAGDDSQPGWLVGQGSLGAGKVDVGDLEQFGVGVAVRLVVAADGKKTRDQALT